MLLTGPQLDLIHETILAAYDRDTFRRVVEVGLSIYFDRFAPEKGFDIQLWAFLQRINQHEQVPELLHYLLAENPQNADLKELSDVFPYAGALPTTTPAHPGPQIISQRDETILRQGGVILNLSTPKNTDQNLPATASSLPQAAAPIHHVFFAYNRHDADLVRWLRHDLLAAGIRSWVDEDDLEPGTLIWQRTIQRAIRDAKCVVAVLSPEANDSEWVNAEIAYARQRKVRIIPVLARGTDDDAVPLVLVNAHYIDVRTDYAAVVQERLIPALQKQIGVPAVKVEPAKNVPEAKPTPSPQPPKVFISYSWDGEAHQRWVRDLATRLRTDGVDAILDQWHAVPGDQLPAFMEQAIRTSDFVLIVCTPKYRQRSNDRAGGAGYEGDIMTAEAFARQNPRKFIPILRSGEWAAASPSWLLGKYYIDLRGDPYHADAYHRLLSTVHSAHAGPPPLGPRPAFMTGPGVPPTTNQPDSVPAVARPLEYPKTTIDFDWVTIPAGTFLFGETKYKFYLPEYRVARVPVTNAQYLEFVRATGQKAPIAWERGQIPSDKEQHPITWLSWEDARAFCKWATVQLPTRAEWEKAARGSDGRIYPWGDEPPAKDLCNFDKQVGDTTPVGNYPKGASPYGVLDMAGNTWEWAADVDKHNYGLRWMRGGDRYSNRLSVMTWSEAIWDYSAYKKGDICGFRVVVAPISP